MTVLELDVDDFFEHVQPDPDLFAEFERWSKELRSLDFLDDPEFLDTDDGWFHMTGVRWDGGRCEIEYPALVGEGASSDIDHRWVEPPISAPVVFRRLAFQLARQRRTLELAGR